MIQEVKYNGYSANPSDYECADGDLAASIGVVNEDGALKPVLPPSLSMQLNYGEAVKYIHKTSSFTHFIIYNSSERTVYAIDKTTESKVAVGDGHLGYTLSHFNGIGNTLLAFTNGGIEYYLWKDGVYHLLGDHIPDVEMSFGLIGHPRLYSLSDESKGTFTVELAEAISDTKEEFSEKNKARITEQVMAKVNKFIAQETVNKGRFCFPFFVRYALRLFDGSLVCHSAPILMNPSTTAAPLVLWNKVDGKNVTGCDIMLVAATIDYCLIDDYNSGDSKRLKNWTDVIKSVDVFISKPIYTYDQDGQIPSLGDEDNRTTEFIGKLYAENKDSTINSKTEDKLLGEFTSKAFLDKYCEWPYQLIYSMYYASDRKIPSDSFHLPEFSEGKMNETLQNTHLFYKLCSIDVAELIEGGRTRKDIIVDDEYLQSLVTREVMSDDYLSRDMLHAKYSFIYNSRLNLTGLRRKPFDGFLTQSMFAYCNAIYSFSIDGKKINCQISERQDSNTTIYVYIKENGNDYVVKKENPYSGGAYLAPFLSKTETDGTNVYKKELSWGCYMFYPNPNAYKLVMTNLYNGEFDGINDGVYAVDLKPHEFLNGAYALLDYNLVRVPNLDSPPEVDDDSYSSGSIADTFPIEIANKIYTSEVNNPFYFPLLGINTVGTGVILGISSAAKALSQGQFGQFPLYAFTTDGVWALEVSGTGTYSAKQPITRDVCINPDSITQIDSAVLFATDRGIMLISGSEVQCISTALKAEELFVISQLPRSDKLLEIYNSKADESERLTLEKVSLLPFGEFLTGCKMIYDYVNQRIIVYNPAVRYAYVYSLKSRLWGMINTNITDNVNSYPEALAMDAENRLVDFSKSEADNITALIVTRPFSMGDPNMFKTIDTIIQRGYIQGPHISQVLYGSNDLFHWHPIWSSVDKYLRGFRGTPYKMFRLALICRFDRQESLYGCTVQFNPRMLNQPR